MTPQTVFLAGSRHIASLPSEVRSRVDMMVDRGLPIVVGDANGADKAFQQYLSAARYANVTVHCMESHCRNNIGEWPTKEVAAPPHARGFDYYSIKDRVMADAADYGLMLWDGKSKGTINNVATLARQGKSTVVYVAPASAFRTIRTLQDLSAVLAELRLVPRRPPNRDPRPATRELRSTTYDPRPTVYAVNVGLTSFHFVTRS